MSKFDVYMNRLCLCGYSSCDHGHTKARGCDTFRLAPLSTEVLVSGYVKTRDEMARESRAGYHGCLRDTAIEYADMLVEFLRTGGVDGWATQGVTTETDTAATTPEEQL